MAVYAIKEKPQQYRDLVLGETILAGDEWYRYSPTDYIKQTWWKVPAYHSGEVICTHGAKVRRPITTQS